MHNVEPTHFPQHLAELMQPTPSGTAKLLAAWDALQTETQIEIICRLRSSRHPGYLERKIRLKALASQNSYIRYLSFKGKHLDEDDDDQKEIVAHFEADDDSLVRYSRLENQFAFLGHVDPELFFKLPQEARLATVRELNGAGKKVAEMIAFVLEHKLNCGSVSEKELYEILLDYMVRPAFYERYSDDYWRDSYDGFGEASASSDMDALWRLVLNSPPAIAHLLLQHLPETGGPLSSGIPKEVLNSLTNQHIATLLYRDDIYLGEFRKEVFKRPAKRFDDARCAAVSRHFDLSNEEFAHVLSMQDSEKLDVLCDLALASDLRLCLYNAIHDILLNSSASNSYLDAAGVARTQQERKLKRLSGCEREKELHQLRIYMLARSAVPVEKNRTAYAPRGELQFLAQYAVPGDTWRTYMAFEDQWQRQHWKTKNLGRKLPHLYGIDVETDPDDDDGEEAEKPEPTPQTNTFEETLKEGFEALVVQIAELRKSNAKIRTTLYAIAAIILIVLWQISHIQPDKLL